MKRLIKRREPAEPGSIPDVLGMFTAELRFSREIAPHVGVRVPVCVEASEGPEGTLLVLEDLSDWSPGADPVEPSRASSREPQWLGGRADCCIHRHRRCAPGLLTTPS